MKKIIFLFLLFLIIIGSFMLTSCETEESIKINKTQIKSTSGVVQVGIMPLETEGTNGESQEGNVP